VAGIGADGRLTPDILFILKRLLLSGNSLFCCYTRLREADWRWLNMRNPFNLQKL
jgi:hypothetical protein